MNQTVAFPFILIILAGLLLGVFILYNQPTPKAQTTGFSSLKQENFEQRREKILNELSTSIDKAVFEGKYHCCIDPPCTMCYLGNWIWKDGSCNCDGMIAKGEFDKVCPQCVNGLEEGNCKSSTAANCKEV